jgi:hypothetical protein
MEKNSDKSRKRRIIRDLEVEPEAADPLTSSARDDPYVKLALAVMGHKDVGPAINRDRLNASGKRDAWPVASVLPWAFADFENPNVEVAPPDALPRGSGYTDGSPESSPLQFGLFLAALFGDEQMEKLISSSVLQVKTLRAARRRAWSRSWGKSRRWR